ncbi:hypothetical protein CI610_00961 [invertebrate metagenome]|uniref:Uncharacterized protein n=1 Tax=invertebrate metagenome TaxID=1711999 RepID=A0A2H9TA04_9ZZZZ
MLVTEHEAGHNRFLLCCVGTAIIRTCEPFLSQAYKENLKSPLVKQLVFYRKLSSVNVLNDGCEHNINVPSIRAYFKQ